MADPIDDRLAALEAAVARLDRYVTEDAITRNPRLSRVEQEVARVDEATRHLQRSPSTRQHT